MYIRQPMQRQFIVNLGILLVLNLIIKPFWPLIIEPAVQHQVGNAAYGEYYVLFCFSFLLNILLDFGITNFNNKNIAENNHLLEKHFSGLIMLKLLLGVLYLVITLGVGLMVGYSDRYLKLLFLLGINQFLISMILYLRSNLLGLHAFKTDSIISVLDRIAMISICVLLLWSKWTGIYMDIMVFVYVQTASYFITAVIAFILVLQKTSKFSINWNWPFWIMILKKSFPFSVLVLLMTFYNRLDSVLIERLLPDKNNYIFLFIEKMKHAKIYQLPQIKAIIQQAELSLNNSGPAQAGIYAKGFRVLDSANMIAYLFAVQLLPIFSRMLKYKEKIDNLVKLAFTLVITPAILTACVCYFYRVKLVEVIYYGVSDSATTFALLMGCFVAVSITYIFGTLLTANGNLKELNTMALVGICLNFLLNIILIPRYMAIGAAVSGLITQFFTAGMQLYLAKRIFQFKTNYRLLITLFAFIAGVLSMAGLTSHFMSNQILGMVITCLFAGFWALSIGLISIKSIIRFVRMQ